MSFFQQLQVIGCCNSIYRQLFGSLGPPQPDEDYHKMAKAMVKKFRETRQSSIALMMKQKGKAEVDDVDEEALYETHWNRFHAVVNGQSPDPATIEEGNETEEVDDEEAIPAKDLKEMFRTIASFEYTNLEECKAQGALELVRREDEAKRKELEEILKGKTKEEKEGKTQRAQVKISAEEKFRLTQLVRGGEADESLLTSVVDESHSEEARTQVELSESVPAFLKGMVPRRAPITRQRQQQQQEQQRIEREHQNLTEMQKLAMSQEQRNKDRKIIKARERRRTREQQNAQLTYKTQEEPAGPDDGQQQQGEASKVTETELDEIKEERGTGPRSAADAQAAEIPPWMRASVGDKVEFGKRSSLPIAEQRRSLPVFKQREHILKHIREHTTTILVGETGSGKTTQIPQYLAEDGYATGGKLIGCTQPRRVAAVSLAERVAEEYGCRCGEEVGYSVRFKDNTSKLTKLKYLTDGTLLREALLDDTFQRYSVIILDEAHERSINTDVLFGILKKAVVKRPSLKLVVTSATLDTTKFCEYFGAAEPFFIEGRTFPVETQFVANPIQDYLDTALKTVMSVHLQQPPGDILVFLTGQDEIETGAEKLFAWMEELKKKPGLVVPELLILPLYATLPNEVQSKVFDPAPEGTRKVVLATNVAETSITIDNLYYVVDPGFCKQNVFDPSTGVEQLKIVPISRAQADQRKGRAGRTGPGMCFRLYTPKMYNAELLTATVPEIQRSNLCNVVLTLKAVGISDLLDFEFMDPPPKETLVYALQKLFFLGALEDDGMLTRLGRRMSELPLDPSQSKVLLTAIDMQCVPTVLTVVSMLAMRNVFYRPRQKQEAADACKRMFHQTEGDQLTLATVYNEWIESGMKEEWCRERYVNPRALKDAHETRQQLAGIIAKRLDSNGSASNSNDFVAVRKAITSGYFFQVARREKNATYMTLSDRREVCIHPSSALIDIQPRYVVYHELVKTSREYMREVMLVEGEWLVEVAPTYYRKPAPGMLTKEEYRMRLDPTLKAWEKGNSWRLSKQRRKK